MRTSALDGAHEAVSDKAMPPALFQKLRAQCQIGKPVSVHAEALERLSVVWGSAAGEPHHDRMPLTTLQTLRASEADALSGIEAFH